MARSRNIKPGFFANEDLAECDPLARLLFAGLWCLADREGRLQDRPKRIKAELLPYDECNADELLTQLEGRGFIVRYEAQAMRLIQIVSFHKHQLPHHKEVPSELPAPAGQPQITRHSYNVPQDVREFVMNRDGNKCLRCGVTEGLSIDHIKPLASGGDNAIDNLQTLCKRCNSSKGDSLKDHRRPDVGSTLDQRCPDDAASKSPLAPLIPDSGFLIPDSLSLIPESSAPMERAPPVPTAPARQPRRATALPADFEPNDNAREIAASLALDLTAELAKFRDYYAMTGKTGKDWQAGFRNWLTKAAEFRGGRPQARASPAVPGTENMSAAGQQTAAALRRFLAKKDGTNG